MATAFGDLYCLNWATPKHDSLNNLNDQTLKRSGIYGVIVMQVGVHQANSEESDTDKLIIPVISGKPVPNTTASNPYM